MTSPDWTWFRQHRDRAHRIRPATAAEIETLRAHGALGEPAPGCAIYALSRLIEGAPPEIQVILQVREEGDDDMTESEIAASWLDADALLGGLIRQRLQ